MLPPYYRYTFEFRQPSWYSEAVLELLRKYNVAFCIYELLYHLLPIEVTADFVYVRLHGPEDKYVGSYSEEAQHAWALECKQWQQKDLDVYVYFDNAQNGYAALSAKRLQEIIRESA